MMVKQLWQKRAKIMLEKLTVVELNEKICTRVFNRYSIDMQDSESLVPVKVLKVLLKRDRIADKNIQDGRNIKQDHHLCWFVT